MNENLHVRLMKMNMDETETKEYEENKDEKYTGTRKMFNECKLLQTMLDDDDDETEVPEIPLDLPLNLIEQLIKFLKYHQDNPVRKFDIPLVEDKMEKIAMEWDLNLLTEAFYVNGIVDMHKYFQWYKMANYVDHTWLFNLIVAMHAILEVKQKEPMAIYDMLGCTEPSEEEAKAIRNDPNNQWFPELCERAEIEIERMKNEAAAINEAEETADALINGGNIGLGIELQGGVHNETDDDDDTDDE